MSVQFPPKPKRQILFSEVSSMESLESRTLMSGSEPVLNEHIARWLHYWRWFDQQAATPAVNTTLTSTISGDTATIQNTNTSTSIVAAPAGPTKFIPTIAVAAPQVLLPDLPHSGPVSDPQLPAGVEPFSPPVGDAPVSPSVAIAASDLSAQPDGNIVLTGNLQNSQFQVFAQTASANSSLLNAQVQDSDDDGVILTLNSSEPANSMYLIWAENSSGTSAPIAVNQTDATWIGSQTSWAGQTVSIYGRNLSNGAATPASFVYLQPTDGSAGAWATTSSVNNYQVNFTVPSGLNTGSYQVWINNGLGGEYGWSQAPMTLTLTSAPDWTTNTFNVMNYGATGNGVTDDGPAIQSALSAIYAFHQTNPTADATLYFPAGNYVIDEQLTLWSNTQLLGAGPTQSSLIFDGNYQYIQQHVSGYAYAIGFGGKISNTQINLLSLSFGVAQTSSAVELVYEPSGSNLTLDNDTLNSLAQKAVDWNSSSNVLLENSTVIGGGVQLIWSHDETIDNTTFLMGYNLQDPVTIQGGYDASIENCTVENMNPSDPTTNGWGQGNFIENSMIYGNLYNEYVGGNQLIGMGTPTPSLNEGELVNNEGSVYGYYGSLAAASSNTVTLPSQSQWPLVGYAVIVDGGTGVGQLRTIVSTTNNSDGTETLTLNAPWTVTPDTTSQIVVGTTIHNSVFYNNTDQILNNQDGQNLIGAALLELWQGGYNLVMDHNATQYGNQGIVLASEGFATTTPANLGSTFNPTYFVQVINNTITDTWKTAVAYWSFNYPTEPNYIGTIVSGNTINSIGSSGYSGQGITLGFGGNAAAITELSVIEHNTVSNTPAGVVIYDDPDVLLFDNNLLDPVPVLLGDLGATIIELLNIL